MPHSTKSTVLLKHHLKQLKLPIAKPYRHTCSDPIILKKSWTDLVLLPALGS